MGKRYKKGRDAALCIVYVVKVQILYWLSGDILI